jgi:hypothetical protein
MKTIAIDNYDFVRSHAKNPSGFGCWGFNLTDDSCGQTVRVVFAPSSTLSDAKKWLKTWVAQNMEAELATGFLSASVAP